MSWLLKLYPGDGAMLVVGSALLQAALVVLLAWLLGATLARRNAALRYAVYLAALAVVLASPVTALAADRLGLSVLSIPWGAAGRRQAPAAAGVPESGPAAAPVPLSGRALPTAAPSPLAPLSAPARPPLTAGELLRAGLAGLLAAWAAGMLFLLARMLHGWGVLTSLRQELRPLDERGLEATLAKVRAALGVAKLPPIMVSRLVGNPITVGLFKPAVVLPAHLPDALPPGELADVLVHECAHVVQRDYLVGFLQRLVEMFYWPLPPVHVLNRRLSAAREEVCDNYVLRQSEPRRYARCLVNLAEKTTVFQRMPATVGLVHPRWRMEDRIKGIVDSRRKLMTRINTWVLAGLGLAFLGTAVVAAGCRAGEQAVAPGEENAAALPGRSLPLSEAGSECKWAGVARLLSLAQPEPGPPGASDYQSKWQVMTSLKGSLSGQMDLGIRVQKVPAEIREALPQVGREYILFSYPHSSTQIRKMVEHTPDTLRQVKTVLSHKDGDISWSQAVNGLQAGLSARQAKFEAGKAMEFAVHLKNTGDKDKYLWDGRVAFAWHLRFVPKDGGPQRYERPKGPAPGIPPLAATELTLAPAKAVTIRRATWPGLWEFAAEGCAPVDFLPPGKYTVTADRSFQEGERGHGKEYESTTGPVEIEIVEPGKASADLLKDGAIAVESIAYRNRSGGGGDEHVMAKADAELVAATLRSMREWQPPKDKNGRTRIPPPKLPGFNEYLVVSGSVDGKDVSLTFGISRDRGFVWDERGPTVYVVPESVREAVRSVTTWLPVAGTPKEAVAREIGARLKAAGIESRDVGSGVYRIAVKAADEAKAREIVRQVDAGALPPAR